MLPQAGGFYLDGIRESCMRTLILIVSGLVLLAVLLWLARPAYRSRAALFFVLVWLGCSAINLGTGLSRGYSLQEELLVHAFLFGVPALAALAAWWRWRPRAAP